MLIWTAQPLKKRFVQRTPVQRRSVVLSRAPLILVPCSIACFARVGAVTSRPRAGTPTAVTRAVADVLEMRCAARQRTESQRGRAICAVGRRPCPCRRRARQCRSMSTAAIDSVAHPLAAEELLGPAIQAVQAASTACMRVQRRLQSEEVVTKEDDSPVTMADYAAQAIVAWVLQRSCQQRCACASCASGDLSAQAAITRLRASYRAHQYACECHAY